MVEMSRRIEDIVANFPDSARSRQVEICNAPASVRQRHIADTILATRFRALTLDEWIGLVQIQLLAEICEKAGDRDGK